MLRKAGHDVLIPADIGMSGSHDAVHLLRSLQDRRTILTKNYIDFEPLHKLIVGCGGTHFGVVLIRNDHDQRKNMSFKTIVSALANVEQAYVNFKDELITLNDWR
jgi:Domain of unknown function (DUF5615)